MPQDRIASRELRVTVLTLDHDVEVDAFVVSSDAAGAAQVVPVHAAVEPVFGYLDVVPGFECHFEDRVGCAAVPAPAEQRSV